MKIPLAVHTVALQMVGASLCSGVSRDAQRVRDRTCQAYSIFRNNFSYGARREDALEELSELRIEYSTPDWDGYGALAISEASFAHAQQFLSIYPFDLPLPEMSVDPDGEVSFEWQNDRKIFTVSISPEGRLSYAGLFGSEEVKGSDFLSSGVPAAILEHIQSVGLDA